ncbi:hypothetical protein ACSR9G_01915 [Citrobacter koseri]|uniref:hypothetical protein n=1 Tax=Citrobacter koseri TaxID=545 RepID=UPI004039E434
MNRELIAAYLNGEVKTLTNSEQKELARIALASLDAGSNSHPAHGPLSNDRLHRISDILRKAAAQRDGGNIGYTMSDAVKAIDELLEVRKAEPVGEVVLGEYDDSGCHPDARVVCIAADGQAYWGNFKDGTRLYATTPAPVTIDERAAFNAWNNEDNLPIAGVGAKNAAWLAWQARARLGSPTAPIVPATLPCAVELKPGLIIGKGCKTETLLTALQRRADYYAEIDAMTPEERAEHDANIEAFKAMLPQPAPVSMKDHQIRELVNELRDIAVEYHGTQQLRERIARTIRAAISTEVNRENYPVIRA